MNQKTIPDKNGEEELHQALVMPEDGIEPVLQLFRSANHILFVKQFSVTHPDIIREIIAAHDRGVLVRVMLNRKRADGRTDNEEARQIFLNAGIEVKWSNPKQPICHEKTVIIDNERALLSTFNCNPKSFGQTRDYGLIISDIRQVADIMACFVADWRRSGFNPAPDTGLFWSPENSRRTMIEFLDKATVNLDIQHPKLVDTTVLERILAAKERGVKVRLLCGGKSGISEYDLPDTLASLRLLQHYGITVKRMGKPLRMHSKCIFLDKKEALLSSMNLCRDSFEYRREIGIHLDDSTAFHRFFKTFETDWKNARNWNIPDALTALEVKIEEEEPPYDPEYTED